MYQVLGDCSASLSSNLSGSWKSESLLQEWRRFTPPATDNATVGLPCRNFHTEAKATGVYFSDCGKIS